VTDAKHLALSVPEERLMDFVLRQRWFGAKSRDVAHVTVVAAPVVRTVAPLLAIAISEIRFHAGTHETYQLPLGFRPASEGWSDEPIGEVDGWVAYDALADPVLARELVQLMRTGGDVRGGEGVLEFRSTGEELGTLEDVRPMGAEQSNSSLVFDESLALKAYRRLEAGINPELELLRFLTERGFEGTPALAGWAAYLGAPLDATLAIAQEFIPTDGDGWELALRTLSSDPEWLLDRMRAVGETVGIMHTVLASDPSDPAFSADEPSAESLSLLTASVDEEIEQVFLSLPDRPELEPIAGRGEEVREQLRQLSHVGAVGRVIRHHGDLHLGQLLWSEERGWIVIDFEGEPARSLPERRRKRSPLRDVAGMLRSFAYAASASEIEQGAVPPEGWEERAREEFLSGYLDSVDASIVPSGQALEQLLAVFELEKAVYELRYELDNRPDWVRIPVAGIARMLDRQAA
jgi:maltokinase